MSTSAECSTAVQFSTVKLAFHDADTDTDFLARILADSPDTPTSPRKILARMSARMSVSRNAVWFPR